MTTFLVFERGFTSKQFFQWK